MFGRCVDSQYLLQRIKGMQTANFVQVYFYNIHFLSECSTYPFKQKQIDPVSHTSLLSTTIHIDLDFEEPQTDLVSKPTVPFLTPHIHLRKKCKHCHY